MSEFWNHKYDVEEYVYGEKPNVFFQQTLQTLPVGKMLLPAEGEGRNAVYAAEKGWEIEAFDQSLQAKEKALLLAAKHQVDIHYKVGAFDAIIPSYPLDSFDLIAIIFLHLPSTLAGEYFKSLLPLLKPGGLILFEGFSKNHRKKQLVNPRAGGPGSMDVLYEKKQIEQAFEGLHIKSLTEEEVELFEGFAHKGEGSVIRFVGQK